jgi:hypothetical protein
VRVLRPKTFSIRVSGKMKVAASLDIVPATQVIADSRRRAISSAIVRAKRRAAKAKQKRQAILAAERAAFEQRLSEPWPIVRP